MRFRMAERRRIVTVGNALVDAIARIPDERLAAVGYPKGHMSLVSGEEQATALARLEGTRVGLAPGGSAANTAVGAARLGAEAAFFGRVADDATGRLFRDELVRAGVRPGSRLVVAGAERTGVSLVMTTPDGQRTMLTNLGAAPDIGPGAFDAELVRDARFLYFEGYLLTNPVARQTVVETSRRAAADGVTVALSASDGFVMDVAGDVVRELLDGPVSLLFANLDEARHLTGLVDPARVAASLAEWDGLTALTLGGDGSILIRGAERIRIPPVRVPVVDTSGAGDLYAAGLLAGLARGSSLEEAGRLASRAAAQVVTVHGPRLPEGFRVGTNG